MTGYERVRAALDEHDLLVPSWGGGTSFKCPAHDDSTASGSLAEGNEGAALIHCHAGCDTADILKAIGLEMYHLFSDEDVLADEPTVSGESRKVVAQYIYTDEQGEPLIRVSRTDPKGFFQERWMASGWATPLGDARRTLYNLPSVLDAAHSGQMVYLVEGEKDADSLIALGYCATTSIGGAGKWKDEYNQALVGARCVVIPDLDEPGEKHAATVAGELRLVAEHVSVKRPAAGKDVSEHLAAGYTLEELVGFQADWDDWDEEIAPVDWLVPGVIARGTLVWAYGPKESAKSMYLIDLCTRLSHEGKKVTYYSEEMALTVHNRYVSRFRPRRGFFRTKWGRGLNLADPAAVERVIEENEGSALIVFDSYEKVWQTSSRDQNRRAVEFAVVASEIVRATGATVVIIDHTGFGYRDSDGTMHDQRQPRGASTKEQQADMSILFSTRGKYDGGPTFKFTMENMKPGRLGNPFKLDMELCDTPDGGLTVVLQGEPIDVAGEQQKDGQADRPSSTVADMPDTPTVEAADVAGRTVSPEPPSPAMTVEEQLAYARVRKLFGLKEVSSEQAEVGTDEEEVEEAAEEG